MRKDRNAETEPARRPRTRPSGFADAAAGFGPAIVAERTEAGTGYLPDRGEYSRSERPPGAHHFPSTGPHGHRARMREKLLERGPDALADYELLEMLLFFAHAEGGHQAARQGADQSLRQLRPGAGAPQEELFGTRGLGTHSVAAMKLVQASSLRLVRAEVMDRPVLNNWDRLMDYLTAVLSREKVEQFRVLLLDTRNRLMADEAQARGTVNHTPVYPREVVKRALELHATALILVHNHPSGDPTPSRVESAMTQEMRRAASDAVDRAA